jgi:hypothetical protein
MKKLAVARGRDGLQDACDVSSDNEASLFSVIKRVQDEAGLQ